MWQPALFAVILSSISGSLYAVDGVTPIDQDRAMAGNITPGDAPDFPVTISQSGSYRLMGNLTVSGMNTTAIQITADSVTLDLNGFSIIGPVVCASRPTACPAPGKGIGVQAVGDQILGPQGVRVLNGSVHGMGLMGIWMTGDGTSVERVNAYNNAGGGISVAGSVVESAANHNGSFGMIALKARDCTVVENAGDGILLDAGGVAAGNVSSLNGGYGIWAQFGTATGNTTFLNKSFGISAFCPSNIVGNTVVTAEHAGIETKGADCVLANNAIRP